MVWIHEHRFIERFSADNMHNVVSLQSFQPENNLAQRHKVFKLKTKLNFRSFCLLMAYNTPGHISHGASCRLAHASELEKAMNDTESAGKYIPHPVPGTVDTGPRPHRAVGRIRQ